MRLPKNLWFYVRGTKACARVFAVVEDGRLWSITDGRDHADGVGMLARQRRACPVRPAGKAVQEHYWIITRASTPAEFSLGME